MPELKPTFGPTKRLARYIKPRFRQRTGRASLPAYMEEVSKPNGLSVNTLELNTENEIAAIYAEKFSADDVRPLAITIHTVENYNEAAHAVGYTVDSSEPLEVPWVHRGPTGPEESYQHAPGERDPSHCLVRYTRLFNEKEKFLFAHRLARKPTYKFY